MIAMSGWLRGWALRCAGMIVGVAMVSRADLDPDLVYRRMADSATLAPGAAGATFEQFSSVKLDGERIIFNANSSLPPKNWAVYAQSLADGAIERVLPNGNYHGLSGANGLLVYYKESNSGVHGIYTLRDGVETCVLDSTMVVPGRAKPFSLFSIPYTDGRYVFFTAFEQAYAAPDITELMRYDTSDGTLVRRYKPGDPMPGGRTFTQLNAWGVDAGTLTFWGVANLEAGPGQGVFVDRGSGPETVADLNTPVPGQATLQFKEIRFPAISDGDVAFTAWSGVCGVYKQVNGALQKVVDGDAFLPGTTTNFTYVPRLNVDQGNVAFEAWTKSGASLGLFVEMGGQLRRFIASGDVLDGQTVRGASFWQDSLKGDKLAFKVTFTNKSQAIYVLSARDAEGDPEPAAHRPAIRSIVMPTPAGVAISWSAAAGNTYAVDAAAFPGGPFTCVASNLSYTGPEQTFVDTSGVNTRRFYRVRVE